MIDNKNYYSPENAVKYMSVSQYKIFADCEAKAMAEIAGEFRTETTNAMLIGSYVDAWFEGTLDTFREVHPEIFLKNGGLKADFIQAETLIKRISSDDEFMKYMSGEKQKIFTGTIAGIQFKGKIDSYHAGKCIVDLKVMRDFESVWKNGRKSHFIEAWGYDIQGAVYQELVFQTTGKKLPFVICAITKEKVPDIAILNVPQHRLDYCLEIVKKYAPHFDEIKKGLVTAERCGKCDFCKATKKLDGAVDYCYSETPSETETHENVPVNVSEIGNVFIPPDITEVVTEPTECQIKQEKKHNKKKTKKIIIKLKV
ncbi:MAG: PD-(D/E)XK nuclease-like domain-containing protein [Ruminococcus sp.]|nr:PD-(D/E)XK nuclease-like domain-containing protein [Ruminococcus sp.]